MSGPTPLAARATWRSALRHVASLTLPRRSDYTGLSRSWRGDLVAGVTVGVVALPLALGFGVASGVGPAAGLITAIVAGFVAAVLGGSHLQVSGPTGAMTVVLIPVVARYGTEAVFALSILAGVLVIIMGLVGMGRLVSVIPWPVVEGFTLGIGVIIFLQQVPLALDTARPEVENATAAAVETLRVTDWGRAVAPLTVTIGVVVLMVLLSRLRRSLPASLIAVAVATVVVELVSLDVERIGALPDALPSFQVPAWDSSALAAMLPSAMAIAALAALESLLSARVADGMVETVPDTDANRELVGQGMANVASGLLGGMPATGAIARTAVNVRAGARTRVASASHAVVLVLIVLALTPVVALIPMSALAGVLIVTAFRMIDLRTGRAILRATRADAVVYLSTVVVTIVFDLIVAVQVGVAVAALLALRAMARASGLTRRDLPPELAPEEEDALLDEHVAVYHFRGALFFGGTKRFLDEMTAVKDVRVVVLALREVRVMDASGAHALGEIITDLRRRGITVLLKGLDAQQLRMSAAVGVLDALGDEGHYFDDLPAAVAHARNHVRFEVRGGAVLECGTGTAAPAR
ncbi:SulP family inorganic anion transporter [Georgenia satyanarayanai]|uniref:SulP family inorganic anion transporter n=1 Tax=Georgenia satyanarayanai TaxID=860221 RepID=UPI0020413FAF|nr:SulP family inorganic anion transporter [Georgenia satyanarayanai]MCM3662080.1 SulP family inorganic anion transporter [Georgenia satyanarayanai]